jgi:kinesin family protein 5
MVTVLVRFTVRLSLVEIYMEHIRDLLDPSKQNLAIREDKETGIWIEDCTETYVSSEDEVFKVLAAGQSNRAVSATKMNAGSSRSHSIVNLVISCKDTRTQSLRLGKLYLVDLAGSEKVCAEAVREEIDMERDTDIDGETERKRRGEG